jgi:glycosyltransferase involved in cell wall biosynthesis
MSLPMAGQVAVAWSGIPKYAAAALRHGIERLGQDVSVVATRAAVPIQGVDEVLGRQIHWIQEDEPASFAQIGIPVPKVLFITGWYVPSFLSLAHEVRRRGGVVIVMVDNCYRGDIRQALGGVVYRIRYQSLFDHAWVPGASAYKLMRSYGVPEDRISFGLYTADTKIFRVRRPIDERPLRLAFVGQFIDRKNARLVYESFTRFKAEDKLGATLVMHGSGPLRPCLPDSQAITVRDFVRPEVLAEVFNETRALVLVSQSDHWPLVVHEATSCGCALILSDAIGSLPEFQTSRNAYIVRASNASDMIEAFRWTAGLNPSELNAASADSVERASAYSHARWANTFNEICKRYL